MPATIALLDAGQDGLPITLIEQNDFDTWLATKPEATQRWLKASGFKAPGYALLPDANGDLAEVLLVVKDRNAPWLLGSLVNQVPIGRYQLAVDDDDVLQRCALSWLLGAYRFDRYKQNPVPDATLVIDNAALVERVRQLADGTALVRDLINTPAADMMPEHLAEAASNLAERFGGEFSQIIGDELLTQNYPAVHAVGRAATHAPRLLDLRWGDEQQPRLTLVGKGVCFDSGGLDIKPGGAMRWMKKDMGGAAHVLGLAQLIMALQLPVRLRVLIPAVENAISGDAFRPGDILNTRKGLTVEVDNTDAEGRLVLCDALAEAETENPDLLIDFATLTGAARVALGTELPAFFTGSDELAAALSDAGTAASDPVWRLPLFEPYEDYLKSDVADLVNCPTIPTGGAITAALYLKRFVDASHWVHFDVMAFNNRALPGRPSGGEAMGMRAVFEWLERRYR
ncbi:leucyl aminopeptidase family protein [Saccharospirillum mangrovi]|uniref:leucyl aminopeptidase family protein n=1 Tax=Saccharospirillum mangrovi TaxID=2161747 RepID=UPI000D3B4005|nr:leucyl aminopeptidase family protein [Saccharospirillum mangrovi]